MKSSGFQNFSGGHTPKASLAAHARSATADLAYLMSKVWLRPCNLAAWKPVSLSIPELNWILNFSELSTPVGP